MEKQVKSILRKQSDWQHRRRTLSWSAKLKQALILRETQLKLRK
jgi:hypothetical protein